MSRLHARFQAWGRGYKLVDMASAGGTFVNEQAVSQIALRPGDLIRIGPHVFQFVRARLPRRSTDYSVPLAFVVSSVVAALLLIGCYLVVFVT